MNSEDQQDLIIGNAIDDFCRSPVGKYIFEWFDMMKGLAYENLRRPQGSNPYERDIVRNEANGALNIIEEFEEYLKLKQMLRDLTTKD